MFDVGDNVTISGIHKNKSGKVMQLLFRDKALKQFPHLFDYHYFPLVVVQMDDDGEEYVFSKFRLALYF
jgi:hypothetical protein